MTITLVVEDGSIVPGANSYVSLDDAKAYWNTWGITFPQGTTDQQLTNALYYAAYSLDRLYGRFYTGHILPYSPQSMLWPRQGMSEHRTRVTVDDPTGAGARFCVRVVDGVIKKVYVVQGGANYTSPLIGFQGKGQGALGTATVTGGAITAINITNGGENYFTPRSLLDTTGRTIFNDEIPRALIEAQCEIAVFAITKAQSLFPEENDARILKTESQKIGGVLDQMNEYWGQQKVDLERYPGYRKIELILYPILLRRVVNV